MAETNTIDFALVGGISAGVISIVGLIVIFIKIRMKKKKLTEKMKKTERVDENAYYGVEREEKDDYYETKVVDNNDDYYGT